MKKFLIFIILMAFTAFQSEAQDTTTTAQNNYFLEFVKKVYFNPTVFLRTQNFRESTKVRALVLPDLNGSEANTITGFEKAMQKIIRFLIEGDDKGSVRFYFDMHNGTAPFSFVPSDELKCKFRNADVDSITKRLNAPFAGANFNLNSHILFETAIDKALNYISVCLQNNTFECGDQADNQTTEINTKPLSIGLYNTTGSKFDVDVKQFTQLESFYAKAYDVFTQQDWYAPAKVLVSGADADEPMVLALNRHESLFKKENLMIKVLYNNSVLPVLAGSTNDSIRFKIPKDLPVGNPVEVVVTYKSPVDSMTYTVGFFMVQVMEKQTIKVNLVAANGFNLAGSKAQIEAELKKIYDPVGITFEIAEKSLIPESDWKTTIEIGSSGLLSNYPPDLRDWVNGVQDIADYDKDEYYLVYGLSTSEQLGYMPRARNIGFIFSGASNLGETSAHELGHGIFHLRHIFADEELGANGMNTTKNVMDYKNVATNVLRDLYLHQWKFIADPAFVSWFSGDDEEGEMVMVNANQIPAYFRNQDDNTYTFLAPDLRPITLPASLEYVIFSTTDPMYYHNTDMMTGNVLPLGSIVYFSISDENGKSLFKVRGSGNNYYYENTSIKTLEEVVITVSENTGQNTSSGAEQDTGNGNAVVESIHSWEKYIDKLTYKRTQQTRIITGFAFFENDQIGFNLYSHLCNNTGVTAEKSNYSLVQNCFSAMDYLKKPEEVNNFDQFTPAISGSQVYKDFFNTNEGHRVKIDGGLSTSSLSPASKVFLNKFKDYTGSDHVLAPILVAISEWVTRQDQTEYYSKCLLSDLPDIIQRMLYYARENTNDFNYVTVDPYTQMEENEVINQTNAANNSILFDAMSEGYRRVIALHSDIVNGLVVENDINTVVSSASTSAGLISQLTSKGLLTDCAFEGLTIDNRIKAIDLFEPENEEELIIKLVKTTTYNAQATALVDRIFQANNSGDNLFERLWDRIDGQEFHQFIQKLTELSLASFFGTSVTNHIELGNRTSVYAADESGNAAKRDGNMRIDEIYFEWLEDSDKFKFSRNYTDLDHSEYDASLGYSTNVKWTQKNYYDYNEMIEITFASSAQDILKFDDSYTNKKIALPAFMLAYLIHKRDHDSNMKAIRVIGNGIVIALAIPSGGTSLTVGAALTIALSVTDIIITVNEDELAKTAWGQDILQAWSVIQWADLAAGGFVAGKALYKYGVKTSRNFRFVFGELDTKLMNDVANSGNYGEGILKQLRITISRLENAGFATWASLINTKLIARMEATIIKAKFSSISESATLTMKNEIEGFVQLNGQPSTKLFNVKQSSSGGAYLDALPNKTITEISAGDKVVGKISKTRVKQGGSVVEKDVHIIKTSNGLKLRYSNLEDALLISESGVVIGKFTRGSSLEIIDNKVLHGGNNIDLSTNKTTTITGTLDDVNLVASRGVNPNNSFNGITAANVANEGGINILRSPAWGQIKNKYKTVVNNKNVYDWEKIADEFWETVNKPWLDEAITRGDNIRLVSSPTNPKAIYVTDDLGEFVLDASGNKITSIFGREINHLKAKGYTILNSGVAVK